MKIITLTGASASGKDLLLNEIVKDNENIKPIISVTTRPKREGEQDGVDYKYISFEEFKELFENEGYELITTEYINNEQKLKYKRKKHHRPAAGGIF